VPGIGRRGAKGEKGKARRENAKGKSSSGGLWSTMGRCARYTSEDLGETSIELRVMAMAIFLLLLYR